LPESESESEPATGGKTSGVGVELGLLGSGLALRVGVVLGVGAVLDVGAVLGVGVEITDDATLAVAMLCSESAGPRLPDAGALDAGALDTARGPVVVHALMPNARTLAVAVRATTLDAFGRALL
jgi:hypothetical protein